MVEKHLKQGVAPERIGFVSFTRKAVEVAIKRAKDAFALSEHRFPNFRTLHSMCFRQLGMNRDRCMNWQNYRELGRILGLDFRGGRTMEDGSELYGMSLADRMMFLENLARIKREPLQKTWESANDPDIPWLELERYARGLKQYKNNNMLLDYTDMLEAFLRDPTAAPKLDVLIGDEMQDTSPLGWEVFRRLMAKSPITYLAGDDDQCSIKGTMVTTLKGRIPVEQLDPTKDALIVYREGRCELKGYSGLVLNYRVVERQYKGKVARITSNNKSTVVTEDHLQYYKTTYGSHRYLEVVKDLPISCFQIPTEHGMRVTWRPGKIEFFDYEGSVYGLDVPDYHSYIADGVITHNCVHRWAGADVDQFINQPGETIVLDQSYRVPAAIHPLAMRIAGRIVHRQPKQWKPKVGETGSLNYVPDMESVDLSKGTWHLLARNGYALAELESMCESSGFSFHSVGRTPLDAPSLKAILIWERMRKGQGVGVDDVKKVKAFTRRTIRLAPDPERTYKIEDIWAGPAPIWHEALELIPERERQYYIAARKRGETLTKTPRIKISTIHSVKGDEAENVLMLTDVSAKTFQTMQTHPDDEFRVVYVGITRASQNLFVVAPKTPAYFEVE